MAAPCSVDSTPTSANQEDHVSMAAHAARRLLPMAANLSHIVGVELLVGAQGVEFREPLRTSAPLASVIARFREEVPSLGEDRFLAPDMETSAALIQSGEIVEAAGSISLPAP